MKIIQVKSPGTQKALDISLPGIHGRTSIKELGMKDGVIYVNGDKPVTTSLQESETLWDYTIAKLKINGYVESEMGVDIGKGESTNAEVKLPNDTPATVKPASKVDLAKFADDKMFNDVSLSLNERIRNGIDLGLSVSEIKQIMIPIYEKETGGKKLSYQRVKNPVKKYLAKKK